MAKWEIPAPDRDYRERIDTLTTDAGSHVANQHIVSRILLKGFASRGHGSSKGCQLTAFDVERGRELTTRGLRGCAKVPAFLKFASKSAEALWQEVETRLGPPIDVARSGNLHASHPYNDVIKDGIALHFVRSPRFLDVNQASAAEAMTGVRRETPYIRKDLLAAEFYRRYGFHAGGVEALRVLLDKPLDDWQKLIDDGALARVSMEMMFERVRATLQPLSLEILHVPPGCELLISDAPAFTFCTDGRTGITQVNMAIGDSHGIALPLARDCLAVISPDSLDAEITPEAVDMFNTIQVRIARKQVYYHPSGELRAFAETAADRYRVATQRPSSP
ncbi:DUF4238 domain-containing protein [Amycolatopsis sp. NPDC058278]|uniref:DUF4238 domain-containing protein n=1 Tax=Amycolatopsis sp. NPDC058278 TaxID=3346417 RepID=UPI0036DE3275